MPDIDRASRYGVAGVSALAAIAAIAAAMTLSPLAMGAGERGSAKDASPTTSPTSPAEGKKEPEEATSSQEDAVPPSPSHDEVVEHCLARIRDASTAGLGGINLRLAYAYPSVDVAAYHPYVPAYEASVAGMQVVVLVPEGATGERSLMFVHGGAYVAQLQEEHMWLASSIAEATGAVVYIPVYPLASATTDYEDTYPPMVELYRRLVADGGEKGLTVFGDSAGAGLATGICEHGAEDGLPQPSHLVLLSPWANVTEQPWMGLDVAADAWSGQQGGGGQRQWQVSPVYGDVSVLGRVTILNGELDGLSKSIKAFYHQLRGSNVDCMLVSEPGEIHDYAYMTGREAACRAFNLICSIVSGEAAGDGREWADVLSRDEDDTQVGDADTISVTADPAAIGGQPLSTEAKPAVADDPSTVADGTGNSTGPDGDDAREFSAWPGASPRVPAGMRGEDA